MKTKNEIDSIFKKESTDTLPVKKKSKKKPKKKLIDTDSKTITFTEEITKVELPKDELFEVSKRKITDDGLPIYNEDELKIGLGKDTEDCPFDCDCCF